ncbi:3-isopropylmalate dehydratase small subunit [Novosphingobium panipatense]|uniref:3-isopropylmalate dehydratase small subunit n=1 Tax=Novosphingobium panipatense TaxID=428991 RepID=UPI0039A06937
MKPLVTLRSKAVPLLRDNIDTDAIIPSREMRSVSKDGLADGLFAGWRYTTINGREIVPDFVLNRPESQGARILLAGANFGCGSSREHAVWALSEFGFRVVIALSFSPIFQGNCIRNGIAPIVLPVEAVERIASGTAQGDWVTVDLQACEVRTDDHTFAFVMEDEARTMLIEGADAIELTLRRRAEIEGFFARDAEERPWIYLSD